MNKFVLFVFSVGLAFTSCTKPAPQIPANKVDKTDKNKVAMLEVNKDLIAKEDSLIQVYVAAHKGFIRTELGFWYKVDSKTNLPLLENKDTCTVMYKLFLLNGNLVQDDEIKIEIGKMQVVKGLEEGLKLLHRGESATFVIPWYLGFGLKGNDMGVPSFTSIIYKVNLKK